MLLKRIHQKPNAEGNLVKVTKYIQYLVDEDEILDAFPCILHSDSILRQLAFTIH